MITSFRKTAAISAAVFFLLTLIANHVQAQANQPSIIQQLPEQLSQDPFVAEFVRILDQWNDLKLDLPSKSALRPVLERRLSETVKLKRYPYETESWQNSILKKFDGLPAQVRPEKRLDTSAEMILVLLFLKGRDEFERQVVKPEGVRKELDLPLFLVLGSAQETAKTRTTIDSNSVSRSLLAWWTAVWPFCK
jgi:hypothetical protein